MENHNTKKKSLNIQNQLFPTDHLTEKGNNLPHTISAPNNSSSCIYQAL